MDYQKKTVYKLIHMYEREDNDEIKELGIYSTHKKAEEAIDRYKVLEGFNEYPVDCFHIEECELDKDAEWTEGFTNSVVIEQDFLKFSECFEKWLQGLDINNEFLYDLECEIYEGVCSMKSDDDIAYYVRKIFERRFEKTEINLEQYKKLAGMVLAR